MGSHKGGCLARRGKDLVENLYFVRSYRLARSDHKMSSQANMSDRRACFRCKGHGKVHETQDRHESKGGCKKCTPCLVCGGSGFVGMSLYLICGLEQWERSPAQNAHPEVVPTL